MGFLQVVAGLRAQLGIDASLSVPDAVERMSELMGLPTVVYPAAVPFVYILIVAKSVIL